MYSVLDVREMFYKAKEKRGSEEKTWLVRLRNPWSGSKDWKGACCNKDKEFWTDAFKSAFRARNTEVPDEED